MGDHKESWKNKSVFKKQLELNKQELYNTMPNHWNIFLSMMSELKEKQPINSFLDVGCGCGAFSELLRMHYPSISYTGMDYSEEAIKLASSEWPFAKFTQKNYTELTKEDVKNFDVVSSCGLHQILPNGDEAIETFLKLDTKNLIFLKLDLTNKESYYRIYKAYGEIDTYEYYHNYGNLLEMFQKYGYNTQEFKQTQFTSHFLLRRQ